MVDLQETPAVPEMETGGDDRLGFQIAGGLLIFLGWVLGVGVNLWVHRTAPSTGSVIGWVRVYPTLGPYAWAVFAFGLFTGVVGVVMIALGRASSRGPIVLPGYDY